MDKPVRVSVVLPVYNGAPFVEAAVRSILDQTFRDFELVLIDDGSTDGSGDILRRLAAADARIRLVQHENRGLVATLNEGLAMARGEYIARMDQDDISAPERFERQHAYLEANPDVLVVGVRTWSTPTGRWRSRVLCGKRNVTWGLFFFCTVAHPGVMFRAEAVRARGLAYEQAFHYAEDFRFWSRLAASGFLDNLPVPLLFYRQHPGSMSRTQAARQRSLSRRILAERYREHFDVALDDVVNAAEPVWAGAIRDRLFRAEKFRALAAADRQAIHHAFQFWSAQFGLPFAVDYLRIAGGEATGSGLLPFLVYAYRVIRHQLVRLVRTVFRRRRDE